MLNSQLAVVALASIAFFLVGPALERQVALADCDKSFIDESASDSSLEIVTIVTNKATDKLFEVFVYRNGSKKNDKFLIPKDNTMKTTMGANAKNSPTVDVLVSIYRRDAIIGKSLHIKCEYTVTARYTVGVEQGNLRTTWKPTDEGTDACEDITEICEECAISCDKNYDKRTWTTTLTISD